MSTAMISAIERPSTTGGDMLVAACLAREVADAGMASIDLQLARSRVAALEHRERARHGGAEVAVLCWPAQRETAARLGDLGLPRMLVVEEDADIVPPEDDLQEWVRLPIADAEARTRLLELRADAERRPMLDGSGRLHYRGCWVTLSWTEERLAVPLVRFFRHVVSYEELATAGWPAGAPSENGRRLMMCRLRARWQPLGLELTTIRGRGYLLDDAGAVR
jgi:hypothetical protein